MAASRSAGTAASPNSDQLAGRGVVNGDRWVGQLFNQAGDNAFLDAGPAAFMEKIEQGRPGKSYMGRFQGVFVR